MSTNTTELEKKSLEAHVVICAERYMVLETKIDSLEDRLDKLESHVVDIKNTIAASSDGHNKQLITIATTVIGVLLTAIFGLITHVLSK